MRINSLALRLIAASALWTLIVLPVAGYVLNSIYRDRVEADFDTRLVQLTTLLIAASALDEGPRPAAPKGFGDPLFDLPIANGWYWQIEPAGPGNTGNWVLMSNSLVGDRLVIPAPALASTGERQHRLFDLNRQGERLRVVRRLVQAESGGKVQRYLFTLTGNRGEIDAKVADFAGKIALSLFVLGLGLVVLTLLQVRFGLRPLRKIEQGLARIRSGEAERLEGELPVEITPLQRELNALIKSNQAIIERARTHVGNLAHALKTPLSVITNEADANSTPLAEKVGEQARLMRDQINHYLDRARMAARSGVIGGVTEIEPVADSLVRALGRIYDGRGIAIETHVAPGLRFQGEKQDLEEMLGNLLDNACKWTAGRVVLTIASETPANPRDKDQWFTILVDDDGRGLDKSERTGAMKRGRRLDETTPGSGLGLSIVGDLAELYRGRFELDRAPAGGLRAKLILPAC